MGKAVEFLDRAVFAGVLAIVAVAPTQFSFRVLGGVNLCLVDPLVWLTAGALGLRLLLGRGLRGAAWPPAMAWLFVGWTALSAVVAAESRLDAAKDLIQSVEYFLLAWFVFAETLRERERLVRAVQVFLAGAAVNIVVALTHYVSATADANAVRGAFGNRYVLGGYLALAVPVLFALVLYAECIWVRLGCGLAAAAGMLVCLSGGAFIGLVAALLGLCAVRGRWVLFGGVAAMALVLGVAWTKLPRENLWALHDSIAFYRPDGEPNRRYPEWQAAAAMALDRPVLGVGAGNYQRHIGGYFGVIPCENVRGEADSQNLYLVLAGTLGLPGALFFAGILLIGLRQAARVYAAGGDRMAKALAAGAFGGLAAFAVGAVWAPLLVRGIGVPLAFVLALPFALAAAEARENESGGGETASAEG